MYFVAGRTLGPHRRDKNFHFGRLSLGFMNGIHFNHLLGFLLVSTLLKFGESRPSPMSGGVIKIELLEKNPIPSQLFYSVDNDPQSGRDKDEYFIALLDSQNSPEYSQDQGQQEFSTMTPEERYQKSLYNRQGLARALNQLQSDEPSSHLIELKKNDLNGHESIKGGDNIRFFDESDNYGNRQEINEERKLDMRRSLEVKFQAVPFLLTPPVADDKFLLNEKTRPLSLLDELGTIL